jgi:hypothetical protein
MARATALVTSVLLALVTTSLAAQATEFVGGKKSTGNSRKSICAFERTQGVPVVDAPTFSTTIVAVDGGEAQEPQLTVRFCDRNGRPLRETQVALPPSTQTFEVEVTSAVDPIYCDLTFSRYRRQRSGLFMPNPGSDHSATLLAVRDPDAWTPQFSTLADLAASRFDPFRVIVAASKSVDFKGGTPLGDLGPAYDTIAGDEPVLAKMCLLNLYAVLSAEIDPISQRPWISAVKRILRLDRERFVAEVDQVVYDSVSDLLSGLALYQRIGFFPEPDPSPHKSNFPNSYSIDDLISIKVCYDQGNLQLTPARATKDGQSVYLLDCDMDEDSNLIEHGGDILAHVFSGGTHPIDIHEYIIADASADAGGKSSLDLGYTLRPKA